MSVRKRSWKTSQGVAKTAWVVDYVDQKGGRHLKTFSRKKEADGFAATAHVEVREGIHTPESGSISVREAGDLWLATARKNELEATTIAQYQAHLTFHIVPYLGSTKLAQLSAPTVREFEDQLRSGAAVNGSQKQKPRSPVMTKKVLGSLSSLLADAQERGLVARNVVREIRGKRRGGKERRSERRQKGKLKIGVDIPTPAEIKAILHSLHGRWRPLLMTAIFTGLRSSELRGLRWRDVGFDRREVHVRQRADRFNTMGAPKSEAGERTVPLTPILLNTLREWKLACPKGPLDLVFPTGAGKVENHANIINRGLMPVQMAAGITVPSVDARGRPRADEGGQPIVTAKYTGLHALRHFFTSWCINRRADGGLELPPKIVQERLGHASIVMTMDTYGHLFPRGDDSAELAEAERALMG